MKWNFIIIVLVFSSKTFTSMIDESLGCLGYMRKIFCCCLKHQEEDHRKDYVTMQHDDQELFEDVNAVEKVHRVQVTSDEFNSCI